MARLTFSSWFLTKLQLSDWNSIRFLRQNHKPISAYGSPLLVSSYCHTQKKMSLGQQKASLCLYNSQPSSFSFSNITPVIVSSILHHCTILSHHQLDTYKTRGITKAAMFPLLSSFSRQLVYPVLNTDNFQCHLFSSVSPFTSQSYCHLFAHLRFAQLDTLSPMSGNEIISLCKPEV